MIPINGIAQLTMNDPAQLRNTKFWIAYHFALIGDSQVNMYEQEKRKKEKRLDFHYRLTTSLPANNLLNYR